METKEIQMEIEVGDQFPILVDEEQVQIRVVEVTETVVSVVSIDEAEEYDGFTTQLTLAEAKFRKTIDRMFR